MPPAPAAISSPARERRLGCRSTPSTQWRRLEGGRNWPPRRAQLGWVSGKRTILSTLRQRHTRTSQASSSTRLAVWSSVRLPLAAGGSTASYRGSHRPAHQPLCWCPGGSAARKREEPTVAEAVEVSGGTAAEAVATALTPTKSKVKTSYEVDLWMKKKVVNSSKS